MKEWFERNAWNVLVIAVPVMMAVLILISEIRDINREIKYLAEKIENNRKESDAKWMQTNKEIMDIHKGTNKKEEK